MTQLALEVKGTSDAGLDVDKQTNQVVWKVGPRVIPSMSAVGSGQSITMDKLHGNIHVFSVNVYMIK